ncbi:hypothetical protein ACROYT_G008929 [Oculina patagonica]
MKFALFLGICLALAFVAQSFEEDEFLEDEDEMDKRHLFKKCHTDNDCDPGECCYKNWLYHRCKAKKGEGSFCHPNSSCYFSCQDHLECRKTGSGFLSYHKCQRPEEPGSGDF